MKLKIGRWNGKKSIKIQVGGLFLGANWDRSRKPAAFCIYNGRKSSWQLQTWEPKKARW